MYFLIYHEMCTVCVCTVKLNQNVLTSRKSDKEDHIDK